MPDTTPRPVMVAATDPTYGCSGCKSPATVLLHPHHGRQCADCMTLPSGPFRSDLATDMAELGRADAALAYLGGFLRREIDVRFLRARIVLALAVETAQVEVIP